MSINFWETLNRWNHSFMTADVGTPSARGAQRSARAPARWCGAARGRAEAGGRRANGGGNGACARPFARFMPNLAWMLRRRTKASPPPARNRQQPGQVRVALPPASFVDFRRSEFPSSDRGTSKGRRARRYGNSDGLTRHSLTFRGPSGVATFRHLLQTPGRKFYHFSLL